MNFNEQLDFAGGSADLKETVFSIQATGEAALVAHHGHSDLWPGDTTHREGRSLYEYQYDGLPAAEPILVGVKNEGPLGKNTEADPISNCGTELGSGRGGSASTLFRTPALWCSSQHWPARECLP